MIRLFKHYISSNAILQILGDSFLFFVAMTLITYYWGHHHHMYQETDHTATRGWIFTAVMVSSMTASGLYEAWNWEGGLFGLLKRIILAIMLGIAMMTLIFYLFPKLFFDHYVLMFSLILSTSIITTQRIITLYWLNTSRYKRRVLVLGAGSRAARIEALYLKNDRHLRQRLNIIGYLPCETHTSKIATNRMLDSNLDLQEIAQAYNIQEIVIAVRDRRDSLPMEKLFQCRIKGIRVTEISLFFEREIGALQLDSISTSWLIFSDGFQHGLIQKRIFDLLISSLLLVLTLPLMLVAALLVLIEAGTPIIYTQERTGLYGKPFTIYKFRSMSKNAEQNGVAQWAQKNDARITRFGKIMRKFRIDELPQIFNVLRGDMSFVGPRPERPAFVHEFDQELPLYRHRHNLKPGITGWAQVCYPYGASKTDTMEKLQYDLYYIKNHSLFLDIMILLKTVQTVLLGNGAR